MSYLLLTASAFWLLLLFPLGLGLYWYHRSKNRVLFVRQNRTRDPRYFSKSFETLFRAGWARRENGFLQLHRPEAYQLADRIKPWAYPEKIETLLVSEAAPFTPPSGRRFTREIYSFQDAKLPPGTRLRAIRSDKNLVLGRGTELDRWADAEGTLAVYDDCRLGISVSSPIALSIGRNCSFRRLYAPIIHAGAYPGEQMLPVLPRDGGLYYCKEPTQPREKSGHIGLSDDPTGIIEASFISQGKLVVDEAITVLGSIRAKKGIHLAEGALVRGNLFSDGDIYLSRGSTVLGSIFTQENVYLEPGVVVGIQGEIRSVIARGRIEIGRDCFLYGYVSAEAGGRIWPSAGDETPRPREEIYLPRPGVPEGGDAIRA